jgi:hypothetical protein
MNKDLEWQKFKASLPATHWAQYDISAVRLGWDAAWERLTQLQQEEYKANEPEEIFGQPDL